jgi:rhamnosyltransferase
MEVNEVSYHPKVSVLVSTYNGEKYIGDQLDSLIGQTYKNIHIYIRDDGSKDETYPILQKYVELYPDLISCNKGSNFGVIESFNHLMKSTSSELYATCDQDDIWLPDKIMKQVKIYKDRLMENEEPFMCFSDPVLHIDGSETELRLSDVQAMNIKPLLTDYRNLVAMNAVPGCTMLFCDYAKKLYLGSIASGFIMHDHLIAVLVAKSGKLIFSEDKQIIYRQHENNVVGSKGFSIAYFFQRLGNLKKIIRHDMLILRALDSGIFEKIDYFFRKLYLNLLRFNGKGG